MSLEEKIEQLERKMEDLRVRRIMVEKEVNTLRRRAAMSPTNPRLRRDLDQAERELEKIMEEERKVGEELGRLRRPVEEAPKEEKGGE